MSKKHPATTLAYAAGIVDGEGCIRVHVDNRVDCLAPWVTVEMAEQETIRWLSDTFGGHKVAVIPRRKAQYRTTYRWSIGGEAALLFLTAILPYLRGKRDQADTLLAWPSRAGRPARGVALSQTVKDERRAIYRRLQEMKHGTAA